MMKKNSFLRKFPKYSLTNFINFLNAQVFASPVSQKYKCERKSKKKPKISHLLSKFAQKKTVSTEWSLPQTVFETESHENGGFYMVSGEWGKIQSDFVYFSPVYVWKNIGRLKIEWASAWVRERELGMNTGQSHIFLIYLSILTLFANFIKFIK